MRLGIGLIALVVLRIHCNVIADGTGTEYAKDASTKVLESLKAVV